MGTPDLIPDILRALNALLAFASLAFMVTLYPWWSARTRSERFILVSLGLLVMVTGYGSLEALFMDVPPGARVIFYTPALLYCLYGVWSLRRKIKKYTRESKDHE